MKPVEDPVTVTVKVPDAVPVHDSVLVPDVVVVLSAMLVGLRLHEFPVEGDATAARATVPVNPFWPLTVMVDIPAVPAAVVTVVGLAVTENVGAAPTV